MKRYWILLAFVAVLYGVAISLLDKIINFELEIIAVTSFLSGGVITTSLLRDGAADNSSNNNGSVSSEE